jgi:hypothetical protein
LENAIDDWLTPGLIKKLRRKGNPLVVRNKRGEVTIVIIGGKPMFIKTTIDEKIDEIDDEELVAK